jgi:hypothetical protein
MSAWTHHCCTAQGTSGEMPRRFCSTWELQGQHDVIECKDAADYMIYVSRHLLEAVYVYVYDHPAREIIVHDWPPWKKNSKEILKESFRKSSSYDMASKFLYS